MVDEGRADAAETGGSTAAAAKGKAPAPAPPPPATGGMAGLLRELWLFAAENKKWWLLPMLLVLVLLGIILFVAAGSTIAPFIYTIF